MSGYGGQQSSNYSFEYYPPRTEHGRKGLHATARRLAALQPDFFSVTYGAGGGDRTNTLETVEDLRRLTGVPGVPHVSCITVGIERLRNVLRSYREAGLRHIVALRGDRPSGLAGGSDLRYASELVEFVRRETGDHFFIEVAAYPEVHPEAGDAMEDLENFRRKVEAGADRAITQFFYNPDAYFRFLEDCGRIGVDIPIVPGIMPIGNFERLQRFAQSCGAEIPRWLLKRLCGLEDNARRELGLEIVVRLCERLLAGGAPGLHFYTLNQTMPTEAIWKALGLGPVRRQATSA